MAYGIVECSPLDDIDRATVERVATAGIYNLLRENCGLSQPAAARFHQASLDSVKSWSSGRRNAPRATIAELQALALDIQRAAEEYAAALKVSAGVIVIAMPRTEEDSRRCGFPSLGAQLRAIAIAIGRLPGDRDISAVLKVLHPDDLVCAIRTPFQLGRGKNS